MNTVTRHHFQKPLPNSQPTQVHSTQIASSKTLLRWTDFSSGCSEDVSFSKTWGHNLRFSHSEYDICSGEAVLGCSSIQCVLNVSSVCLCFFLWLVHVVSPSFGAVTMDNWKIEEKSDSTGKTRFLSMYSSFDWMNSYPEPTHLPQTGCSFGWEDLGKLGKATKMVLGWAWNWASLIDWLIFIDLRHGSTKCQACSWHMFISNQLWRLWN